MDRRKAILENEHKDNWIRYWQSRHNQIVAAGWYFELHFEHAILRKKGYKFHEFSNKQTPSDIDEALMKLGVKL